MPGDLHTHTNFSDGSSDIELLPKLAARAGLTHRPCRTMTPRSAPNMHMGTLWCRGCA